MTTTAPSPSRISWRARIGLASLFVGAFVLGSGETMPVGVLTLISDSTGENVASAGYLVTTYALSLAIGGLLLSLATARWARRTVLFVSLAATVAANLIMATSDQLGVLLVARVVGGAAHGWFIGAAIAIAISLVPADRIGRAIGIILTGLAASTAFGVPAGVFVAGLAGWHTSFVAVAAITAAVLASLAFLLDRAPQQQAASLLSQARHAFSPGVLKVLGIALVIFAGEYGAFTYISPFLQDVSGVSVSGVGVYVLAFGVAGAVGSALGGRLADWNPRATLAIGSAALPLVIGGLLLVGASPVAAFAVTVVWGVLGILFVPSVQYLVGAAAGPGRDLASVLPASGINLGIAAGSMIGGLATTVSGASGPLGIAVIICALAVPGTFALWLGRRRLPIAVEPVVESALAHN